MAQRQRDRGTEGKRVLGDGSFAAPLATGSRAEEAPVQPQQALTVSVGGTSNASADASHSAVHSESRGEEAAHKRERKKERRERKKRIRERREAQEKEDSGVGESPVEGSKPRGSWATGGAAEVQLPLPLPRMDKESSFSSVKDLRDVEGSGEEEEAEEEGSSEESSEEARPKGRGSFVGSRGTRGPEGPHGAEWARKVQEAWERERHMWEEARRAWDKERQSLKERERRGEVEREAERSEWRARHREEMQQAERELWEAQCAEEEAKEQLGQVMAQLEVRQEKSRMQGTP